MIKITIEDTDDGSVSILEGSMAFVTVQDEGTSTLKIAGEIAPSNLVYLADTLKVSNIQKYFDSIGPNGLGEMYRLACIISEQ